MPTYSFNYSVREEMRYIVVMTPEGFINQEKETRHIFNATIQLLYCNIIFRPLILKMDFHTEIL